MVAGTMLDVVEPGIATTVQDLGRPGLAHLGVPPSGAVDPALARLVNRLVGNDEGAAVIETCGGLVVRALGATLVASSTEPAPVALGAGQACAVAATGERLWHYLAVRGGIAVEPVLGSRATDTLSGLGPPVPARGTRLPIGPGPGDRAAAVDVVPLAPLAGTVRVTPGPRAGWFAPLTDQVWTVAAASRVGVRLTGATLQRRAGGELASEGLVRGAIQVPPDGAPVMMLADHPTTGGYPVIAVVHPDDVAAVAHHRPGTQVRLRPVLGG